MDALILYALFVGIIIGLYYAMMAVGLNLVFGVLKIINLAHGDFIMLAAYLAFWLYFLIPLLLNNSVTLEAYDLNSCV